MYNHCKSNRENRIINIKKVQRTDYQGLKHSMDSDQDFEQDRESDTKTKDRTER